MITASATQATSFTYRHVPRHHSPHRHQPSQHRERSSRESRSASRALMRDVQGGIRLTHPAHVLDTSHTYSHVPPLLRSPHHGNCIPSGHARRKHSLQTVCINRSLSTAPVDKDLFLRTVSDHSPTEMQHILRACPLFFKKNISKRLSDNHKNHYLCIHNHSTASLKRRSEAHTSPPSPLSTKQ